MQPPNCPKCTTTMEPGIIVDKGARGGSVSAPEWADGMPESSIWTGLKLRGHELHAVVTYRCPQCGYLESYAPSA